MGIASRRAAWICLLHRTNLSMGTNCCSCEEPGTAGPLCHMISAGPRDRQVAAGTGLCHQLPQGHPAPPDCHSQGAALAPSHSTKGTRGLPDPGAPPWTGDLSAAPQTLATKWATVLGYREGKGSSKGCVAMVPPVTGGVGLPVLHPPCSLSIMLC